MAVRYDSPTWHGFSVSADWGDDDFWDVAARYSGEFNGFKLSAAAAYNQWTDGNACNGTNLFGTLGGAATCISGSNVLSGLYPDPGRADYFQVGCLRRARSDWSLGLGQLGPSRRQLHCAADH